MDTQNRFDAAVYFDSNDNLQTIDRNDVVIAYNCSVYRENLQRCLVYLDDMHTRGTDLKFPLGWKAAVTLSGDITRDKTVQCCMRMRQLGKGHSISFLASFEADIKLRNVCKLSTDDKITNENVLDFIRDNSRRFEQENMCHWATAGLNYTEKYIGHELFENTSDNNALDELYKWCIEKEIVELAEMYRENKQASLQEIVKSRMDEFSLRTQMTDAKRQFVNDKNWKIKI